MHLAAGGSDDVLTQTLWKQLSERCLRKISLTVAQDGALMPG